MAPQEPAITMTPDEADYDDHHSIAVTFPNQNIQKEEKQITIDPMSLKEPSPLLLHTTILPPLHPPKSKFLSISQPNSATSTPRFAASKRKQILAVDQSSPPIQLLQEQETYLQKSKSCGEGRANPPSEGFEDFLFIDPRIESNRREHDEIEAADNNSKGFTFKCCLYLPGFGKTKPSIRSDNKKEESNSNHPNSMNIDGSAIISRTVSLERFECGSWAPSSPRAVIQADMEVINDTLSSHYFDLPSELIRCGAGGGDGDDDAHSPVTAAFVFDNKDIKGVLKSSTSRGRKSDASPRHVRFSISSASTPASPASPSSCITPRLRRAREEFHAYLEAQSV